MVPWIHLQQDLPPTVARGLPAPLNLTLFSILLGWRDEAWLDGTLNPSSPVFSLQGARPSSRVNNVTPEESDGAAQDGINQGIYRVVYGRVYPTWVPSWYTPLGTPAYTTVLSRACTRHGRVAVCRTRPWAQ